MLTTRTCVAWISLALCVSASRAAGNVHEPAQVSTTPSAAARTASTAAPAATTESAPASASQSASAAAPASAPARDVPAQTRASGEDKVASLAALSDTPKKCGLGAAFHAGRRAALVAQLTQGASGGIVLVRGLPKTRDYTKFRQDKVFWYLTGIESPDATLVLDLANKTEILFLPKPSPWSEAWEGELWDCGDEWVKDLSGFRDIRPANELEKTLRELIARERVVWICKLPHVELSGCVDRASPYDRTTEKDALDGRASREDALEQKLVELFHAEVRDFAKPLSELRRVKTSEEIDAMRRAARAGCEAMKEAIRSTRPGAGEWDLEAVMTFVHRQQGADGPAYHAIVGSGPNALMLHYSDNGRRLRAGEMVLLDYGPELDHYTSDITRSWPSDGVFTPRMIEIYDAVLAAQLAGIAAVKPGATMRDVHNACRRVLSDHGMAKLMPHGACHYIGLEVHDVGMSALPLEPGVVFTVEPGVYDPESGIGVRIEDVVVVTASGCEVISACVPKDRAALVALYGETGLLEARAAPAPEPALAPASAPTPPLPRRR